MTSGADFVCAKISFMKITFYTKPECHLCDVVKADLMQLRARVDFAYEERNIEEDEADFERFRYLIPVVDVADGPMLYAPISRFDLENALGLV